MASNASETDVDSAVVSGAIEPAVGSSVGSGVGSFVGYRVVGVLVVGVFVVGSAVGFVGTAVGSYVGHGVGLEVISICEVTEMMEIMVNIKIFVFDPESEIKMKNENGQCIWNGTELIVVE